MPFLPHAVHWDPATRMPRVDPRENPPIWTPQHRFVWEQAFFTVPAEVSEERVQFVGEKYRRKFGASLEARGFEVLGMDGPNVDRGLVAAGTTDPNRRAYAIWAKVRRRPTVVKVQVPDEDVPMYLNAGFKLVS